MGVFNDTLMAELLDELGQLREMDVVLVNWGAWYPRFTWGYSEVIFNRTSCAGAACSELRLVALLRSHPLKGCRE